jgi:hypothetical protein
MVTRRTAILAFALGSGLVASGMAASDFWNDKQPNQWAEKDVQRLLSKSPWAKDAAVEIDFGGMGGPGMGGPGMGPPGMDGPGGFGGPGGPGGMSAVVRWESAAPVRDASKNKLEPDPAGSYVISVSGFPMLSELVETMGASGLESMKKTTSLQRGGKAPVAPSYITVPFDQSGVLLFYFPSDADPISSDDKQVVFQTKSQAFGLKAKFVPKEMLYRGKLAL